MIIKDPIERFWNKINKHGPIPAHWPELGQCWVWTDALGPGGYSQYRLNGKYRYGHRIAYTILIGEIAAGLVLDHLCINKICVNPAHLEPVTYAENNARAVRFRSRPHEYIKRADRTHCLRGHELTPQNTIQLFAGRNGRACVTCSSA